MNNPDQAAQELIALATERYTKLTAAEETLLRAVSKGGMAVCGPSDKEDDPSNDPAKADGWGPERQVRAELIQWLCTDAASHVDRRGIHLLSANVVGRVDLLSATVPFPLGLVKCRVADEIVLQYAHLALLSLSGSWTQSIMADGVNVAGSVFLRGGFTSDGEVRLLGAKIGGDLDCSGGHFENPFLVGSVDISKSLAADGVAITGNAFLRDGFTAVGEVRLLGAQIGGNLECSGGKLRALNTQGAKIGRHLFLQKLQAPKSGTWDLTNATSDALLDDEESWPAKGNLYLDGFVYGRISEGPTRAETRLKWLALLSEFKRHPYRQLAKVLREMGDDRGARKVLYEMERRARGEAEPSWFDRTWMRIWTWIVDRFATFKRWLLKWSIGYGYYPLRALVPLALLTLLGTAIFGVGYLGGSMAPTERQAYDCFEKQGWPPRHYQQFNPFVYSLENSVPLLKLGQDSAWAPDPGPREQEYPGVVNIAPFKWLARVAAGYHLTWLAPPSLMRGFRWLQIVMGWILATLLVAGVTGVVRRE
jgi:hypothetical protein